MGELSPVSAVPPVPPEIPIGLPSDLLRRRPDVRQAERQLAAETARIGVAEAEWFPKLSLTGDVGVESVTASKWFVPGSLFWSVGPSVQWRIFDFGRVRSEVQAQTAVQEAALASYEKVALTSLQEAENAIVAYAREQNRHTALAVEVKQNRRSLAMADASVYQRACQLSRRPRCRAVAVSIRRRTGGERSGDLGRPHHPLQGIGRRVGDDDVGTGGG